MFVRNGKGIVRSFIGLGLVVLLGACGGPEVFSNEPAQDNDTPVGDYEKIFSGAPKNDSLPVEGKADTVYPEQSTEVLAFQSPVKSQGSRGVCSIFSTVAYMEHLYIKAGHEVPDFSEQYLQWSVKFQEGSFPHSSGSNAASNLRAIHNHGVPAEEAWPYEPYKWTSSNDPECEGESMPTKCYTNGQPPESARQAKMYFLPEGRYISTRSIKHHIHTQKTGVVVGVDFFYQAWNHRRSTLPTNQANWSKGIVLYPSSDDVTESHKHRAGHSILLVGWDDTLEVEKRDKDGNVVLDAEGNPVKEKGFYIFKNSWGTGSFGVSNPNGPGYGYISFKYIERYGSARTAGLPDAPGGGGTGEQKEQTFSGSVQKGEFKYHSVQLGAGAKNIKVEMEGDGDADLYTQFSTQPDDSSYECRPYKSGSRESCTHPSASGDTLEIGVYGWQSGTSNYTVKVTWTE
jgi:C1A family cysteine protease